MDDKTKEWSAFFEEVFKEAKKIIYEQYKVEEDGSGPPEILAIRKTMASFPCPLRIAEIKVDTEKHNHIKDEICQILRYDFSKLGERAIEYLGIVDAKDPEKLKEILVKSFDLSENSFDEFYRDFRTIGWSDDETNFYTQLPLYDIKNNFGEFVSDFVFAFNNFGARKISEKYRKVVDWNSKFNLKPDLILPISELTKMDQTLTAFLRFTEEGSIEELQKDVSDIQLIPAVPEDVKRVFQHAKDLYIYGFFRYNFFTIAQHYAYLSLESAVKNRYYQSFGKEIVLTNDKGESVKIGSIDHQLIIDFCRRRRLNPRKIKINNEKFAFTKMELLDWLVKKGIITKWERRLCERGMKLRDLMLHLTRARILTPGYSVQALRFVADLINKIYSEQL